MAYIKHKLVYSSGIENYKMFHVEPISHETIRYMARHNKIGELGEDIAVKWLKSHNFKVIERNYRKKWGEIDIVAHGTENLHFFEVKTVSYETVGELERSVSHETWRPEDNVHYNKVKRLSRAIETWIYENRFVDEWQFDVLTIKLVLHKKFARINLIDNVILE